MNTSQQKNAKQSIGILGAGAWGTAVAQLIADNGHDVLLWCYESEVVASIKQKRVNEQYLPGIQLHENIIPTTALADIGRCRWIFEAIPVKFLRTILTQLHPSIVGDPYWVVLSKGIEHDTLLLPSAIMHDVFGKQACVGVFAGPTFAKELVERQFTATHLASDDEVLLQELYNLLANHYFRPFGISDLMGAQVGGALKNVLALAVGLAHGMGCKDNTTAYLLTRGLEEIGKVAQHFGGKAETVYGLSGLGDMILTCTGSLSKNLRAGKLLAQGSSLDELVATFKALPEGINTVQSVQQLIERDHLDLPLCQAVYQIIFKQHPPTLLLAV